MKISRTRRHALLLGVVALAVQVAVPMTSAFAQDGTTRLEPMIVQVHEGKPDLEVQVTANPATIYGGSFNGVYQPSSVTITLNNRLTPPQFTGPVVFEGAVHVFGSDVQGALVTIDIPAPLTQVGNVGVPAGFQCAVSPDRHKLWCWGGSIPAGASVDIDIDVVGEYGCGYTTKLRVVADPYFWIDEAFETNNEDTAEIFVFSIC